MDELCKRKRERARKWFCEKEDVDDDGGSKVYTFI